MSRRTTKQRRAARRRHAVEPGSFDWWLEWQRRVIASYRTVERSVVSPDNAFLRYVRNGKQN